MKKARANSVSSGSLTLPAEAGQEQLVAELARRWGADFIRDSDGTALSPELIDLGKKVYSTICIVRAEQTYPRAHSDHLPEMFLMSGPVTATGKTVTIDPLAGFHREKYVLDTLHDPTRFWEVIDRTTGELVPPTSRIAPSPLRERAGVRVKKGAGPQTQIPHPSPPHPIVSPEGRGVPTWSLNKTTGLVTVRNAQPFHVYTVSTLCWVIWDTTSMYNHLVNKWEKPHVISVDPYHRPAWDHLMGFFKDWLAKHPDTDLVRLTTLAYHFTVIMDPAGQDKFRDWTGYQETVSVAALEDFRRQYGYRLRAEDFVDQGYYNSATRVPSKAWLDWMDFIHRFVVRFGRELVAHCHKLGKTTGIFWGDHWIGVEFYSPHFQDMGIDVIIGAAEDGVALRRAADVPGPQQKELRLYPYLFPDVFRPGGKPTEESQSNWVKIRRALLRKPIDRIGYGGYVSLVKPFPDFVEHVEGLTREFRTFKANSGNTESWKPPVKVLVLNAWGRKKAWLNSFSPAQKFLIKRQDVVAVAGTNLLECLSGLGVVVDFADFEQIKRPGGLRGVDVIINDGDGETAWSGGRHWADPEVISAVRGFVHRGGGFIGCRGPTAFPHQGRYFQLSDVLGVDKEVGQSTHNVGLRPAIADKHFITDDDLGTLDFRTPESFVFVTQPTAQVLAYAGGHVMLAANTFGRGRSVFLAGLPFSLANSRLLLRAVCWAAGEEDQMTRYFASNINTDCAAWPNLGRMIVVNNVDTPQTTVITLGDGKSRRRVSLKPYEAKWVTLDSRRTVGR